MPNIPTSCYYAFVYIVPSKMNWLDLCKWVFYNGNVLWLVMKDIFVASTLFSLKSHILGKPSAISWEHLCNLEKWYMWQGTQASCQEPARTWVLQWTTIWVSYLASRPSSPGLAFRWLRSWPTLWWPLIGTSVPEPAS